jgi:hypothetical protein
MLLLPACCIAAAWPWPPWPPSPDADKQSNNHFFGDGQTDEQRGEKQQSKAKLGIVLCSCTTRSF